jgi:hypothetical protein
MHQLQDVAVQMILFGVLLPIGYVMMSIACVICSQAVILLPSRATVNGCTSWSNSEGFTLNDGACYACSTLQYVTGAATSIRCVCSDSRLFCLQAILLVLATFIQTDILQVYQILQ